MRAFTLITVAVALFVAAAGEAALPEFVPCSFHGEFHTRVLNPDREVVSTSVDNIYYDHDNLWRWDSDFSGLDGVLPGHQYITIWRPDLGNSYHDYGDKCRINDGGKTIAPFPYDYLLLHTDGITWFRLTGTWEDMPVYYYTTTFYVKNYDTTVTANVFILQDDNSLVFINGTAKSDKYFLDLTYNMDAISYEHNVPMKSSLYIPSAHCSNTTIKAPDDPSADFKKQCYESSHGSAASHIVISWLAVVLLALAMLF